MFKKIKRQFRNIDMLGSTLELNMKGEGKFKTYVGGFISITIILAVGAFCSKSFLKLVDDTSPTILARTEITDEYNPIGLADSQLLPMILVISNGAGPVVAANIPKIATFRAKFVVQPAISAGGPPSSPNGTLPSLPDSGSLDIDLDVVSCEMLVNKKPYRYLFETTGPIKSARERASLCIEVPEDKNIDIQGYFLSNTGDKYLSIMAYPCILGAGCEPDIRAYNFVLGYYSQFVRYSDYKDPVKKGFKLINTDGLSPTKSKLIVFTLKNTILSKGENSFFEAKETHRIASIDTESKSQFEIDAQTCNAASINNSTCQPLMSIEYHASGSEDRLQRTYPDLLNVASEIGGFKEVVVFICLLMYTWYNDWKKTNLMNASLLKEEKINVFFENKLIGENKDVTAQRELLQKTKTKIDKNQFTKETKKKLKEINKTVKGMVESNSSFVTLVQELNSWRLIKQILLEPYQMELLPLVSIEVQRKKEEEKKRKQARDKSLNLNEKGQDLTEFIRDTFALQESLRTLVRESRQSASGCSDKEGKRILYSQFRSEED